MKKRGKDKKAPHGPPTDKEETSAAWKHAVKMLTSLQDEITKCLSNHALAKAKTSRVSTALTKDLEEFIKDADQVRLKFQKVLKPIIAHKYRSKTYYNTLF